VIAAKGGHSVLVAQLGARRHYAVPRALEAVGALSRLVTDATGDAFPWCLLRPTPSPVLPAQLRAVVARRVDGVPAERITCLHGVVFHHWLVNQRAGTPTARWIDRNRYFGKRLADLDLAGATAVYGFNAAGLELLTTARRSGRWCILDQTAAPWRWNTKELAEEAQRWPGWESVPAEQDLSGILAEREEQEWALADRIICGSRFVAARLLDAGVPSARPRVVPPPRLSEGAFAPRPTLPPDRGPVRVLFVGSLQLRKGLPYLVEAMHRLGDAAKLTVIGPSQLSRRGQQAVEAVSTYRGPLPLLEVAAAMRAADVLVLPTISEGSANVCREAMAIGVPVITTDAAGIDDAPPSSVKLVPRRDISALVEAIASVRVWAQEGQTSCRDGMDEHVELVRYGSALVS
jgi:glycosyltransferase involved in cell wall biosynthesis